MIANETAPENAPPAIRCQYFLDAILESADYPVLDAEKNRETICVKIVLIHSCHPAKTPARALEWFSKEISSWSKFVDSVARGQQPS